MTVGGERWSCVSTDVLKWDGDCRNLGYSAYTTTVLPRNGPSSLEEAGGYRRTHKIAKSKAISLASTSGGISSNYLTCAGPSRFSWNSLWNNVQRRDLEPFPSRSNFFTGPKLVSKAEMLRSVPNNLDKLDRLDEASLEDPPIQSKEDVSRKGKEIAKSKSQLQSTLLASSSKELFSDDDSSATDYMSCISESSISENYRWPPATESSARAEGIKPPTDMKDLFTSDGFSTRPVLDSLNLDSMPSVYTDAETESGKKSKDKCCSIM